MATQGRRRRAGNIQRQFGEAQKQLQDEENQSAIEYRGDGTSPRVVERDLERETPKVSGAVNILKVT